MQDNSDSYTPPEMGARAPGLWATVFTWAGAIASIALIVGVAMWTYRLGVRDAQDVPIIQAMAGPAKVAPDDPGGKVVPHQGLAVNEVLAGTGVKTVASVSTAPQTTGLTAEDRPRSQLAALERAAKPAHRPKFVQAPRTEPIGEAPVTMAHVAIEPETDVAQVKLPSVNPNAPLDIDLDNLATPVAKPAKPTRALKASAPDAAPVRADEPAKERTAVPVIAKQEPAQEDPVVEPKRNIAQALAEVKSQEETEPENIVLASLDTQTVTSTSKFAPANSLAPTPRKRVVAAKKPDTPSAEVATATAPEPVSANEVRPGTRMIQLGAYGSEAVAKSQWDQIITANADLLGEKQRFIQRTSSNGKTFYRLRASSFDTLESSRAACSVLSARNVPCIPTVAK